MSPAAEPEQALLPPGLTALTAAELECLRLGSEEAAVHGAGNDVDGWEGDDMAAFSPQLSCASQLSTPAEEAAGDQAEAGGQLAQWGVHDNPLSAAPASASSGGVPSACRRRLAARLLRAGGPAAQPPGCAGAGCGRCPARACAAGAQPVPAWPAALR